MGDFSIGSSEILSKAIDALGEEHLKEIRSFIFRLPEAVRRQALHKTGSFRTDFLQRMSPELFRKWLKNRVDDRRTASFVFSKVLTQFFNERYKHEQAEFFKKAGMPAHGHLLDPKGNWNEYDWEKCGKAAQRLAKAYPAFPLNSFLLVLSVYFRRNAQRNEWAKAILEATGLAEKLTEWHKADVDDSESDLHEISERERFIVEIADEKKPAEPHAEEVEEYEARTARPAGDWETVLDKVIKNLIVSSSNGEFGALTLESVADLVDEVIHLNTARSESMFHAGFLEALSGVRLIEHEGSRNDEASRYYTLGLVCGYAQAEMNDLLVRKYDSKRKDVIDLLYEPEFGVAFGSQLEYALQSTDRWSDSASVLECRATYLAPGELSSRLETHREMLSGMVRDLRAADGLDLARALEGTLEIARKRMAASPAASASLRISVNGISRRTAQCLMAKKDFHEARKLLSDLASELENDTMTKGEYAATLADLALAKAAIGDLSRVYPLARQAGNLGLSTLAAESDLLSRAIADSPDDSPKAQFLLGAVYFSEGKMDEAVQHFETAIPAMKHRWERTQSYPSLAAAHLMLAFALNALDAEHNLDRIITSVERAAEAAVEFEWDDVIPILTNLYALGRIAESTSLLLKLAELKRLPQKPGKDLLDVLAALAAENEDVWRMLEGVIESPGVSFKDRFKHYSETLRGSKNLSESAVAAFIEKLDSLASEHPSLTDDWIDFLLTTETLPGLSTIDLRTLAFERAWENGDGVRLAKAAESGLLKRMTTIAEKSKDPGDIDEIEEYLLKLKSEGISSSLVANTDKRLAAVKAKIEEAPDVDMESLISQLRLRGGLSVIVIGGDETQAQYEEKCRAAVAEELDGVADLLELKFNFTCWSRNFGRQFENMKGDLAAADVVVVHRLMRTILGRMLRKYINDNGKKWVTCVGRGSDSLVRAIMKSIEVAVFI